ncbi:MAG: 8-oxo-dGTP diphosphatase [Lachnospiraceae bacterium]|nr:8-oxo-dGTP diphosphatase [Lachnospiraceae bacterium]MBP3507257.1 8-oxo-dGTP diphosphatase [Lachnospiraceae bacterium]
MSEHINNLTTLCYIEKDDCYLMLHRVKKEQDVNKDKWIGIGGHFEAGESPEECLLREVKEETGLTLTNWRFRGIISFTFQAPEHAACSDLRERESQNQMTLQWEKNGKLVKNGAVQADMEYMCLYTADGFEGEMTECEEGNLEWIPKSEIYNLPIWEGDKLFFQLLDREVPFFSLKLDYIGEDLIRAVLDGKELVL